jgi:hypothetical protein
VDVDVDDGVDVDVDVHVDVDVDVDVDGDVLPANAPSPSPPSRSPSASPRTALIARIAAAPSTASAHVLAANARRPSAPFAWRTRTRTSNRAPAPRAFTTSTSASIPLPRSPAIASTRAPRSGATAHSAGPDHAIAGADGVPAAAGLAARDGTLASAAASKTIEKIRRRHIVRGPYASRAPAKPDPPSGLSRRLSAARRPERDRCRR